MYVFDYGAPVGWELALTYPDRVAVAGIVSQNGNACLEGLGDKGLGAATSLLGRSSESQSAPRAVAATCSG